jgi:hypothetical protein
MPKQFPRTAQVERQGVALCATTVAYMGHIWREKGISDVGIDGEIELVDLITRQPLGRLLLVQSKARTGLFDHENKDSFSFRCTADDLDYWLSATAPVLLVCSHPENRHAWFKNVTAWFSDHPDQKRSRVIEFNKTTDRFDASGANALLEWGVPSSTGIYLRPVPRPETLVSNLLRLEHLASTVHVAPSSILGWKDINARLRNAGHEPVDDVVWRDKQIYSFRPLDVPPLDSLIDDTPERVATDELADSKSDDDRRLLVRLLNNTLRELRSDLRWNRDRGYLYFPATDDLHPRKVKATKAGGGRTVFERYMDNATNSRVVYYRHYALRYQFVHLTDGWYLALNPTYHFTRDGYAESRYASECLKRIKRIERHAAVASLTRFWATYLRSPHDLFSTPDPRMRFGLLAELDLSHGIDDSQWKPRDGVAVADVNEGLHDVRQAVLQGVR